MPTPLQQAQHFLKEEKAFRLGTLPTESFHPKTKNLSQTLDSNPTDGIRLLQSVDDDIPPIAQKVLDSPVFRQLTESFLQTIQSGRRFFFTGCGATGRLSILLEAAWRQFWIQAKQNHPEIISKCPDREDIAYSIMAGGDFALIKSVEGFEDFTDFGRHQLKEAGVQKGDLVVAITEGGETSFVIGTAWQALETGAEVFFVYNNPTETLCEHVQRSREIIEAPAVRTIDLFTGPMAISGSTRMQATTIELLIVAAALEIALAAYLKLHLSDSDLDQLGIEIRTPEDYHTLFCNLLADLSTEPSVRNLADITVLEEQIYTDKGLVTYFADNAMLDVLTDTTERSPTFMTPPYRRIDDNTSPLSWSFAKNPFHPTRQAWSQMLQRSPRGLDWQSQVYKNLNAPKELQTNPTILDNNEIYKFQIGNETDTTRTKNSPSCMVILKTPNDSNNLIETTLNNHAQNYDKTAIISIGQKTENQKTDHTFNFDCKLPRSPLDIWQHLAAKLILNTFSTATMTRMHRVIGNAMVWVSPSNKKLIDRSCRLIAHITGTTYENACVELHKAIQQNKQTQSKGIAPPSPVAAAINKLNSL